jgi:hypothetical protein
MGRSSRFSGFLFLLVLIAGGAACLHAQTVPPTDREAQASAFAHDQLASWQKRLNLEDWQVSIVLSPKRELRAETLGNIHWDPEKKTAVIRVLSPADYTLPEKQMLDDMEFTIVHELIHLRLAPLLAGFDRSAANHGEEEHVADYMAEALLGLERNHAAPVTSMAPHTGSSVAPLERR